MLFAWLPRLPAHIVFTAFFKTLALFFLILCVCMFSECHGTHDHAKISKIAFQDTFVISGSFSPQCARFRLPPLIVQHAKLKCRSDDPRNHSKWGAVNYCFFAIGAMNSAVNWLVGMPARRTMPSAMSDFCQKTKFESGQPCLCLHCQCITIVVQNAVCYCWKQIPPSPVSSSDPYQSMLTETVDRFTYPSDGQCCTASIRPPALISQRITRIEPRTTTKKNNMTRKN